MRLLAPFVERRSSARLREVPLRRRNCVGPQGLRERRASASHGFDVAATLEIHLDRYPTKPAMLAFLQSLIYAAEGTGTSAQHGAYLHALHQAAEVLQTSEAPLDAVATMHGYHRFMGQRVSAPELANGTPRIAPQWARSG